MAKFNFAGVKAVKEEPREGFEGRVDFYAIDENGQEMEGGRLFALLYRGVLFMYKNVSPKLGLKLDKKGRVVVEGVNDR